MSYKFPATFRRGSEITDKAHPSAGRMEFTLGLQDMFTHVLRHQHLRPSRVGGRYYLTFHECRTCGEHSRCLILNAAQSRQQEGMSEQKKASALCHNPNRLVDKHSPELISGRPKPKGKGSAVCASAAQLEFL